MQFAVGGAFGYTALWGHLALGLAWTAVITAFTSEYRSGPA